MVETLEGWWWLIGMKLAAALAARWQWLAGMTKPEEPQPEEPLPEEPQPEESRSLRSTTTSWG